MGAGAATSLILTGSATASTTTVIASAKVAATATTTVTGTATGTGIGVYSSSEKLIFDFDPSKIMGHIFSADHIKNGIMNLGNSTIDIFNKIQTFVSNVDSRKVKEGSNFMIKSINGIQTTIRFFVKDSKVISIDAFIGTSNRILGNLVD